MYVLLLRDQDDQSIQFYDHDKYSRVNYLSQTWSYGTDFLLHLSDYNQADIIQHSYTSISQTDAYFSTVDCAKREWGRGSNDLEGGDRRRRLTPCVCAMHAHTNTRTHHTHRALCVC